MIHFFITFQALLSDLAEFGRWRMWRGVAFAVAGAGLEGVGLVMLLPLLASVGVAQGNAWPVLYQAAQSLGLAGLLILWAGVVIALSWFNARREVALTKLSQDFIQHINCRLYRALLGMDWGAFQQMRASDAATALTGTSARLGSGLSNLTQLFAGLLLVGIHTAIALYLVPLACLAALVAGGILALTQSPLLGRMKRHGDNLGATTRSFHATVLEQLSAMKMAKSHAAEDVFARSFAEEAKSITSRTLFSVEEQAKNRAMQKINSAIFCSIVVFICVEYLNVNGATLLVLIAVFSRLLPSVAHVVQSALRLALLLPCYDEIEALRQHCLAHGEPDPAQALPSPQGAVRLDQVTYAWPNRDLPAIDAISLDIIANQTTALVGPSGAGKSTLADLCLGLLEPKAGRIMVGDTVLTAVERRAWRRSCAIVPQDVFLFHHTVRANLLWANPHCSEDELWRALAAAAADRLVEKLPQGLDTVVGDRGVRLSGGERQRLALARALLRRPLFLVLDEATSHLDHEHERLIQESLERLHGQMTVLVIAHRLSTVRSADKIAVIADGKLRECGTWDQLQASGGFVAAGLKP